jgi:hypothetical protein
LSPALSFSLSALPSGPALQKRRTAKRVLWLPSIKIAQEILRKSSENLLTEIDPLGLLKLFPL